MTLSPLDDYPVHQAAEVMRHPATSDRNFYDRYYLSQGTVRNHLSAAIQKLGARNRAEAVQIAERKGWL